MIDTIPSYVNWIFILTTIAAVAMYLHAVRAAAGYVRTTLVVFAILLGVHGVLAARGFYIVQTVPPRFPLAPVPSTVILLALFLAARRRLTANALQALVLLSIVRVPVEVVLFWLYQDGQVPQVMTFEGRNLDILSGLSAPLVAWLAFRGGRINRGLLIAWHVLALALLVNIVTTAILSIETPFQRLAFDQPNRGVLYFPFIWLPAVIVPIVFVSHVISLVQLAKRPSAMPASVA